MRKNDKRSGDLLGSQCVQMTRDFKLPCRYVKSHALIDPVDLPLLSQLALATSDRRLEELWLFRCSYHSAYFPVDEECPGELVPISKDERITVPIFVANVLIKHKAASVISSVESEGTDSPRSPNRKPLPSGRGGDWILRL